VNFEFLHVRSIVDAKQKVLQLENKFEELTVFKEDYKIDLTNIRESEMSINFIHI